MCPFLCLKKKQYIIIGVGSAGLQLAKALLDIKQPKTVSILLIDQSDVMIDKTWCFWCHPNHHYRALVKKEWQSIAFIAPGIRIEDSIAPMTYQYIQSGGFYNYHQELFSKDNRISQITGSVNSITSNGDTAFVHLEQESIAADYIFCTNPALLTTTDVQPKIWQHFIGWIIETTEACFQTETSTMMDFDIENNAELLFMYILPLTATKAIVECTIFSATINEQKHYEKYIARYIKKNFTHNYQVVEVELGKIPMQLPKTYQHLNKRVIPIGTAAGCIKASTGYSFIRNMENTKQIVKCIKKQENSFGIQRSARFEFYDSLLLDIIEKQPSECVKVFYALFKNNSAKQILKFLDEKTTIFEDVKFFLGLPKKLFINTLFKRFQKCFRKDLH